MRRSGLRVWGWARGAASSAPGGAATRAVLAFLDSTGNAGAKEVGRAWRVDELRLKGFDDLRKLWWVCLKERNVLDTEKEWCRSNKRHWTGGESKLVKLRLTMARIQTVVGERARTYLKVEMALRRLRAQNEGQEWDEQAEQERQSNRIAYLKRTHTFEGLASLLEENQGLSGEQPDAADSK